MKGIIYDALWRNVLYKFDTPTLPVRAPGERLKEREDIDDILFGRVRGSLDRIGENRADVRTQ